MRDGYFARWRGREFEVSPDGNDMRLYSSTPEDGFTAVRPEEEIPAGTVVRRAVATGPLKEEIVDGKTRVTYGVQTGDTLWAISQRFNCSVDELRQWNGLSKRKKALQVGTVLVVWPKPKTASVLEQELTVHSAK